MRALSVVELEGRRGGSVSGDASNGDGSVLRTFAELQSTTWTGATEAFWRCGIYAGHAKVTTGLHGGRQMGIPRSYVDTEWQNAII